MYRILLQPLNYQWKPEVRWKFVGIGSTLGLSRLLLVPCLESMGQSCFLLVLRFLTMGLSRLLFASPLSLGKLDDVFSKSAVKNGFSWGKKQQDKWKSGWALRAQAHFRLPPYFPLGKLRAQHWITTNGNPVSLDCHLFQFSAKEWIFQGEVMVQRQNLLDPCPESMGQVEDCSDCAF